MAACVSAENTAHHWTCYVCKETPSTESQRTLTIQEKAGRSAFFIDFDHRIYLRCRFCLKAFHANCKHTEIELYITQELTSVTCTACAEEFCTSLSPSLLEVNYEVIVLLCMTSLSLTILRDGQKTEVACTNEVADMLQSEETDDAVKELIIRQLVGQNSASTSSRSSVEKVTEENDTSVKWTKAAEKLLLEENKKVEDRGKPLKNKWKQIAGAIESFGFKFTADQCRLKFRGLKDKYERQKKRANTSGEAGIDVDTQLEDCFETLPDVKPLAVLDTDVEATKSRAVDAVKVDLSDNESTSADVETQPKKRRRSSTVTDDLKAFLKDESERREAAQERRHKEKIDVTMSLVTVLRDLAQK